MTSAAERHKSLALQRMDAGGEAAAGKGEAEGGHRREPDVQMMGRRRARHEAGQQATQG